MEELDLRDLLTTLRKRWWAIVIITIIFTAVAAWYSIYYLVPIYSSDTSLYVGKDIETDNAVAYNDIILGDRLVSDYRELVKSRRVTGMTIQELGLIDTTSKSLAEMITVQAKSDTRIIEITVLDKDPETARDIADKVAEIFTEQVVEIMEVQNVQVIDKAIVNLTPVKPNVNMNILIAFILGIMVGTGLIFVIEYIDNSIKSPEDIKKYLELPILGVIPKFNINGKEKR